MNSLIPFSSVDSFFPALALQSVVVLPCEGTWGVKINGGDKTLCLIECLLGHG